MNKLDENEGFSDTRFKFKLEGLLAAYRKMLLSDLIGEGEMDLSSGDD